MVQTDGRKLLLKELGKPDRSQSWLARQLSIKQSSVSLWVHGRARPETHLRTILEALLGIPRDSWLTKAESLQIQKARDVASGE